MATAQAVSSRILQLPPLSSCLLRAASPFCPTTSLSGCALIEACGVILRPVLLLGLPVPGWWACWADLVCGVTFSLGFLARLASWLSVLVTGFYFLVGENIG